jgi:hypothetical protein
MTEVVYPLGGPPVALRPCPSWCILKRHFADGQRVHVDDGFHHYGPETAVPVSDTFPGEAGGSQSRMVIRAVLKAWTQPLGAAPGPARIELNFGTAEAGTDMAAEITPDEALTVTGALTDLVTAGRGEAPHG